MRSCHPLIGRIAWIVTVVALATALPSQAGPTTRADAAPRTVVILGASLSAGFICPFPGEDGRVNRTVKLKQALAEFWDRETARVSDCSDFATFLDPVGKQTVQVDRAKNQDPDLLIGIDFLFWFGYGVVPAGKRLELLEKGLEMLTAFDCPIVVGDFPDMTGADPRMLRKAQIPSTEELRTLNERVRSWAAERANVRVFPLAKWVAELKSDGRTVVVEGEPVKLGPAALMQSDRLHPTKLGIAVVADGLRAELDAFLDEGSRLRVGDVSFDAIVESIRADLELEEALAEPTAAEAAKSK
ncbi:MAG: SGNH/GDSL hydrolase family protein [Planctomycetes bacterium]|nr:SGNH/GDSL hydrolase family protein [Planctomycetota bacterium]